ncbi:PREDICTED: dimethyladenosine transferase 2, mitochondrial isoform X1 [Polistes canadensis]|uniref:dimethyladenosine transferase 2, mitochondrial isoform X1 n=3 Tax=Polistes canadensis TaxID=91411 RepID=UPI000718DF29|nr:PREDICTED: dimethyladenosine transferase 2, mitochondrial isoform X1 [Polistes canadensis]
MISINFIISLIKQMERIKPLTMLLTHTKSCLYANYSRLFSNSNNIVTVNNIDNDKIKRNELETIAIKKGKAKILSDFKEHTIIEDIVRVINPELGEICPKKYMKIITGKGNIFYLMEKNTATKFVQLIINDLSKDMSFVAECNPGIGILTEELLNAGIKKIYAFETNHCFYPKLNELQTKYPNRLVIRNANLFEMSKLHFMDQQDNMNRIKTILNDIPDVPWENESTYMQVIGVCTNIKFFKHLLLALVFRNSCMKFGRPSFYTAITPSLWNALSSPSNKAMMHYLYISFQTLFNCKYLGDIERMSYIPWKKQSLRFKNKIHDHEILKVVKIEPKAELFNNYLKLEEIIPYWYFVKYHYTERDQRIIPELEKWVPGSGLKLIQMDYNIFTRFIDLTPIECLNLYKEFVSWPEFESSMFLSSAHSYVQIFNQINISTTKVNKI